LQSRQAQLCDFYWFEVRKNLKDFRIDQAQLLTTLPFRKEELEGILGEFSAELRFTVAILKVAILKKYLILNYQLN
jgi:hypothetical protein